MSDEAPKPSDDGTREISDLVGAELAGALGVWLIAVLVCFFLVGPVAGIIAVLAGVIGFGAYLVAAVRRADTSD